MNAPHQEEQTRGRAPQAPERSRLHDVLLAILYALIVAIPALGVFTKLPDVELDGALAPLVRPPLSSKTWLSEKFQPAFSAWLESRLWPRSVFVYADNSVLYHAFGETKPGAMVRVQKDGYLILNDDIAHFSRLELTPEPVIARFADLLSRLQQRLQKEGAALVPVIVPSKASIVPDKVSERWMTDVPAPRPADVEHANVLAALRAKGISFVDGRAMLTERTEPRTHVFGRGARHWSYFSSCLVTREILRTYETLTGKAAPIVDCEYDAKTDVHRLHEDYDLVRLLNVWNPPLDRSGTAILRPSHREVREPLDLLMIGTSFCWFILKDGDRTHVFKNEHFFYYNALLYDWPTAPGMPPNVVPQSNEWKHAALGKKLYILDMFEIFQPSAAFLEQLEIALDARDGKATK